MNQKSIKSFLKLGYYLDYENPNYSFDFSGVDKKLYKDKSLEELIGLGTSYFMEAIDKSFVNNNKHVVPISGGMDSRAILAGLLEFTEASNIHTYTFGTPGTLDYDIGKQIANVAGTTHVNLPLTEYEYNIDELLDISKRVDHQTVLFHHPSIWQLDELFSDYPIWSGFMGDPLVGARYEKNSPIESNAAKSHFLNANIFQKNIDLVILENDLLDNLITIDKQKNTQITSIEFLDFNNRQLKYIAPHVLIKGFNYRTPFLNQDLFNFYLSVDNQYREDQFLYKEMLLTAFPKLFSYPVKNNLGLPLKASKLNVFIKKLKNKVNRNLRTKKDIKNINYLDFGLKIREKSDLKEIVISNIHDLYERDIIDWIDIRQIYKNHMDKKGEFGEALLLLASLEIHMKAKEIKD